MPGVDGMAMLPEVIVPEAPLPCAPIPRAANAAGMEYVGIEEGKQRSGLRLVLTAGVPGPWGEAAKSLFHVKGIPYTAVRQIAGKVDETLRQWTHQTSAPVAILDDERPRSGWAEILFLAERLRPEPALVPSDPGDRARMLGVCHEICGEQGFGWNRRLMLFDPIMRDDAEAASSPMGWKYGYTPEAADAAPGRTLDILNLIATTLRQQRDRGSDYLFGDTLTAADVYWATFAAMVKPLPAEQCPMPDWMRPMYDLSNDRSDLDYDPIVLSHRDFIYKRYLSLPMDF